MKSILRKLLPNTALTVGEHLFGLFSATFSCICLSRFQSYRSSCQANMTINKQTKPSEKSKRHDSAKTVTGAFRTKYCFLVYYQRLLYKNNSTHQDIVLIL